MDFYSTSDAGLARIATSSSARPFWLPLAVLYAAMSFNFALCFVNTNIAPVTVAHVIGSEVLIISLALLVAFRTIGTNQIMLILGLLLYLVALSLIRASLGSSDQSSGAFDIKIMRDFMIPIAFFLLGTRVSKLSDVDKIVRVFAIVVTAVALFEYFLLDVYVRFFNIMSYYLARGSLEYQQVEYYTTTLYISGFRPDGRSIFPFLGEHRVSSIFIEPVSPGNFAVALFFWALVRSRYEKTVYYGLFLMAIFLTIMADNRFSAFLCIAALCASMIPLRYLHTAIAAAPFVAIPSLLIMAAVFPNWEIDNSTVARFIYSGYVLGGLNLWDWLGVGTASSDGDSGYAYTITQIGLLGFIALWGLFMTLKNTNAQFQLYRSLCGMYLAAILCVSYSCYSIKTASLLWFLLGALSVARGYVSIPLTAARKGLAPAST